MNNRFRIKQTLGYFALSLLIGMTGAAWGGDDEGPNELDLSDVPLFIGDAVIPNVYIEMDDSGSMDWDVLTSKYWHYCAYDSNALGNTGNSNCGYVVDSGLLRLYALPPNGINGSFQYFEYILDSPDDAYGQSCTGSRQTLELCSQATIDADWRARSAAVNVLYYNPEAIYEPWPGKEDADFSKARSDPQPESDGYEALRDLGAGGGFTFHHWVDDKGFDGARPRRGRNHNDTVGANG
ncbi:MAG TPA: hypothetical protein ENK50_10060, partial [Sedimenticola sp.]|nr:hypothetical protein [Sedimenticola sp.]